jgi:hypothetical protein
MRCLQPLKTGLEDGADGPWMGPFASMVEQMVETSRTIRRLGVIAIASGRRRWLKFGRGRIQAGAMASWIEATVCASRLNTACRTYRRGVRRLLCELDCRRWPCGRRGGPGCRGRMLLRFARVWT